MLGQDVLLDKEMHCPPEGMGNRLTFNPNPDTNDLLEKTRLQHLEQ